MNTRELRSFIKKAERIKAKLSKDRDDLRDLMSEYEDILTSANEAESALMSAVDSLSELL